jgi:segregation and condensation protein B
MDMHELRAALESILFVSNEPVKVDDLAESFPEEGKDAIVTQLEEIQRILDANLGGFMLEQTAGGWRLATRAEHDPILRKYFSKKGENRLSIAALETMAIVAYRQPITAPEVSDIRGVNSTGVIRTLLERRMVRVSGRKNVVGSPFLYRTTREFLVHFGLNDIRDLPRLEEFGDLIGENINDDLVAAINAAPETSPADIVEGGDIDGLGDVTEAADAEDLSGAQLRDEENASSIVGDTDPAGVVRDAEQQFTTSLDEEERAETSALTVQPPLDESDDDHHWHESDGGAVESSDGDKKE